MSVKSCPLMSERRNILKWCHVNVSIKIITVCKSQGSTWLSHSSLIPQWVNDPDKLWGDDRVHDTTTILWQTGQIVPWFMSHCWKHPDQTSNMNWKYEKCELVWVCMHLKSSKICLTKITRSRWGNKGQSNSLPVLEFWKMKICLGGEQMCYNGL